MRIHRVDVVLARGASAASAAATLFDEVGIDLRVFAFRADGDGMEAVAPPGGAADGGERLKAEYVVVIAADAVPLPGAVPRLLEAATESPDALILGVGIEGAGDRERMQAHTRRHLARAARFADASFVTVYGADEVAAVLCRRATLRAELPEALLAEGPVAVLDAQAERPCRVVADPVAVRRAERPRAPATRRAAAALDRLRRRRQLRSREPRSSFAMAGIALAAALGLEGSVERLREARRRIWERVAWRALLPIGERAHDYLLARFADWPIAWTTHGSARHARARKIAYYVWRFPVVSETFIRREVAALAEAGVDVAVLADGPGAGASDDPELAPLLRRARYVLPVTPAALLRDLLGTLVRTPLRTANLLAYTLFRPYQVPKSLARDVAVFLKAVRVAAMLRRSGVTHLHAPWGDTNAFIGMVAARLAGADFSVQFRAQDLHRRTLAFQVREKVRNARFVVTNTRYNLAYLRSLAAPEDHAKIRQIYNGLELERLAPRARDLARREGPVRVLSVARLIEPKGLPYLFEACRILLDRGRDLRCSVIGGPELPQYVNDLIEIRRSRRRLGLDDVVELLGAQPFARVVEAYTTADVFALPCVVGADASNDITPNAILEAMAMGVPVVATRITAIPELIEDGESGLLVPPHDAVALAEAIARLIDDPALAVRLAANARARIAERFDVSKNVRAYTALFGLR